MKLANAVCERCGSREFRDFALHHGRTVRRDCADCGRTLGFPVWYGHHEQPRRPPRSNEIPKPMEATR